MKKIITLFLVILQYTTLIISKEVHIVPLYQERLTGKWCGLFGRDAGGLWSTFKQKIEQESDADMLTSALQTLKEQTNGVYSFEKEGMQKLQSSIAFRSGDVVYCVPVEHMTIPMLQRKMVSSVDQDIRKDKFVWIPMEELLSRTTIVRTARNMKMRYKFDNFTKSVFNNHWESLLQPQLNAAVNREKALAYAKRDEKKVAYRAKRVTKPAEQKPVVEIAKVQTKRNRLATSHRHNRYTTKSMKVAAKKPMKNSRV